MATSYLWSTPPALATTGNTLNSLATLTTDLGSVIDNSTARKTHMNLELFLDSYDASGQTNPALEVYLLASADGTNYQSGEDAKNTADEYPSADTLLCTIGFQVETAAQDHRAVKAGLVIPPLKFKLLVINKCTTSFPASGCSLKYHTYNWTDA